MPTVAEMIAAIRGRGKSTEEIAAAIGVTAQAVASWESGRVRKPRQPALGLIEAMYRAVVGDEADGGRSAGAGAPSGPAPEAAFDGEPAAATASGGPAVPRGEPRRAVSPVASPAADTAALPDRAAVPPPRAPGEVFRFIHCADLHVDSPLEGLQKIDERTAPWIQTATRRALQRLVDMAIADRVNFVVISGDIFDGDWKSADTGFFVRRQLARLSDTGIPVYAIAGNHDALSQLSRSFRWPDRAHRFGTAPESIVLDGLDVVIHGRSFGERHESGDFVEAYPAARAGLFNIGLLHTSLAGASGHAKYAPCSPAQLASRGYDYWALGHVHVPQVVRTSPHVVYSGNIQGRGVDETGPRGCYVVTVDAARRPEPHFVPLDDVRWARVEVPLGRDDVAAFDDVVSLVVDGLAAALPADGALLAARVLLTGTTPLHRRLLSRRGSLRADVAGAIDGQLQNQVWLEKIAVETSDPDAAPPSFEGVPRRAVDLIADEFCRLEATEVDALLAEHADIRALFDALQPLDQGSPGRRDALQAPEAWRRAVEEARILLDAELGAAAGAEGAA